MKTILVTGGAGFIGSHFVELLIKITDFKIIVVDKLTYAGKLSNMSKFINDDRINFYRTDISNLSKLSNIFENNQIDYVINFAAESHVDNSINNPRTFIKSNFIAVFNLLECSKKKWQGNHMHKFIQISTDEVYGSLNFDDEPFNENSNLSPSSPYSSSKAASDLLCLSYFKTYGFPVIITRSSNNFGPRQDNEKFIPKIISNALNNKDIPVYGNGLQIRDWLFVEDNCRAILKLLFHGEVGQVYNIGNGFKINNIDLAKLILSKMDKTNKLLKYVKDRPGHDLRYEVSDFKLIRLISDYKESSFEQSIEQTIKYYSDMVGLKDE